MININFKVTENEVTKINQVGDSTTGSIGQIKCTFDLDPIYSDMTCVAVFNDIKIPMIRGVCYADNIPEGRCVVGVYAYSETDGTVDKRISPKPCVIVVDKGSYLEGHDPEPPTASETERFYNLINEAISSGKIKGDKGDKGDSYILTEADKNEIAQKVKVPTKTSELKNDSGYITADDAPPEVYIGSTEPQGNEVIWIDDSTTPENINATKAYVDEVVNLTKERIVTDTENTVIPAFELADNTEYRFTLELESIEFTLPDNPTDDYISSIVFKSGTTATTIIYPDLIKWSGDDLTNDKFVPFANKRYTVMIWYDGIWNGLARGVVV